MIKKIAKYSKDFLLVYYKYFWTKLPSQFHNLINQNQKKIKKYSNDMFFNFYMNETLN